MLANLYANGPKGQKWYKRKRYKTKSLSEIKLRDDECNFAYFIPCVWFFMHLFWLDSVSIFSIWFFFNNFFYAFVLMFWLDSLSIFLFADLQWTRHGANLQSKAPHLPLETVTLAVSLVIDYLSLGAPMRRINWRICTY